jgi:hypothetical protein
MKLLPLTVAVLLAPGSFATADLLPDELVVEAIIDGPAVFHLREDGFYWENGKNAKPGKWNGRDEPTYVNGTPWVPHWAKSREERGKDKCELFRTSLGTVDVEFKLIAVTKRRGETGIEPRSEIATKREGNEFVITIPDTEPEARWYKFSLSRPKKTR